MRESSNDGEYVLAKFENFGVLLTKNCILQEELKKPKKEVS
jgi:hypothetical protein